MEVGQLAVNRLKLRQVCLCYQYAVDHRKCSFALCDEEEGVFGKCLTDGETELCDVNAPVEQYAVGAIAPACDDGERVGELRLLSFAVDY